MSSLEACLVIVLRPGMEPEIVEDAAPYRALIRAVRVGGPGTEAVIASAVRPEIRTKRDRLYGPRWGEWKIEAYACEEPLRQLLIPI